MFRACLILDSCVTDLTFHDELIAGNKGCNLAHVPKYFSHNIAIPRRIHEENGRNFYALTCIYGNTAPQV
jgi:hypothetical protein